MSIPFETAYRGRVDLPPLTRVESSGKIETPDQRRQSQENWTSLLSDQLYGPIPAPPNNLVVTRHSLDEEQAERIVLQIKVNGGTFTVDAALWLPNTPRKKVPVICGLDFIGPVGLLSSDSFPLDLNATIYSRPEYGAPGSQLTPVHRGCTVDQWPIQMMLDSGYGVLVSCYGSWVPDDPKAALGHGLLPFLGITEAKAVSLWAWALKRLLDASDLLPETANGKRIVAGHSRLGKAALWAAANDTRVDAVFANESGSGGAALARHDVGETLVEMQAAYPHWIKNNPNFQDPDELGFDQHMLIGSIAPRKVYLGGAEDDLWADPLGSYMALVAASKMWSTNMDASMTDWPSPEHVWHPGSRVINGELGWHLRLGPHELRPEDWRYFLDFLQL